MSADAQKRRLRDEVRDLRERNGRMEAAVRHALDVMAAVKSSHLDLVGFARRHPDYKDVPEAFDGVRARLAESLR